MSGTLLGLYHRMPPPLRNVAASARGLTLRRLRYGRETDELVEQALERESWTPEQWRAWRATRLAYVLHRAATRVPYYRAHWEERRRRGDRASWELLENWPVLEKDTVRQQPRALVAEDCRIANMICEHTSGTSGKPLELWMSRDAVRAWYALFEARCRRWYGLSRQDRWGILGGQLVAPAAQTRPPFWVWNAALRQLYLSVYHLSPATAADYVDAIRRSGLKYLVGYSSALDALAEGAGGKGRELGLRAILTNAEPLLANQRARIERAFECPVYETYGMSEIVAAANQCEQGSMHLWPEAGVLESLDGDLLSTGLVNADMPLIRYRTGDRCELPANSQACACGRSLPLLGRIEGRCDDTIYTRDGRRIGRLDPIFKSTLPIQEAQIVQESLDRLRILCVPDAAFDGRQERELARLVRERVGDVEIAIERVDRIPRGANGKFRAVVCNLPPAELEFARSLGAPAHAGR